MGWIASRYGVAEAMALGGAVCLVIGVAAFAWLRRLRADALIAARTKPATLTSAGAQPSVARPR